MQKILFVDHAFHNSTASSQFFVDLLRKRFEVEVLYIEPAQPFPAEAVDSARAAEAVVIWQMDYLAPVFLAMGLPTIVVPMYDGSAYQCDLHWIWSRQARFINFSFTLHHRIRMVGGDTTLVKYFKAPAAASQVATFDDGLKVFLWQRRPEHGINARAITRLLGSQITSLHIHNAPDDPSIDATSYAPARDAAFPVTTSKWFAGGSEYGKLLGKHNVFIAPRRAEGIGMAMLEAMSRGMLVIATDEPTHNEYIVNWVNGILFDPDASGHITISHAAEIGQAAYATVASGHVEWKRQAAQIANLIATTARSEAQDVGDVATFATALSRAYYDGPAIYANFMLRNSDLVSRMSGEVLGGRVDGLGNLKPALPSIPASDARGVRGPWLVTGRIPINTIQGPDYLTDGRVEVADGVAWVVGHELGLAFQIDPFAELIGTVTMTLIRPAGLHSDQTCLVSLNGWTLGSVNLTSETTTVSLPVPAHILSSDCRLRIQSINLGSAAGLSTGVSAGISEIAFS